MGPPLNVIWPRRPPQYIRQNNTSDNTSETDICSNRKSFLANAVDNLRCVYLNFTLVLILLQVIFSLSVCVAGPVLLSPEYMRGHVTLARNIRHLPCISRRSGQEGVCMFAIDCLKANGSHLGTCIDRFYFGSCCQVPDKTILPQIVGNNIEDNSIESSNFVHPQGEDKISENVSKIPDIFPTRKPSTTTEKAEKETEQNDQKTTPAIKADGATDSVESKTETISLDENKVADEEAKITTETYVEVNIVDKDKPATKTPEIFTEIPIKLSTFQSVSVESNNLVTETSVKVTDATSEVPKLTTITTISTQAETTTVKARPQTTRKPIRPTYKPRPTYRPNNSTKPQYSTTNLNRPKPIKPINVFNSTRKPPYRPPPKRPSSTKKPLPIPPRLNITILPQLPNTRPTFNKPVVPSIMYINTTTTSTTTQKAPTSTTSTTTTSAPMTTSTAAPTSSSEPATTEREEPSSSPIPTTVAEEKEEIPTTLAEKETTITEEVVDKTTEEVATEKLTAKPTTEVEVSTTESVQSTSSTEFPPGLVTWSNTVDSATKAPEKTQEPNATESEEIWSPITPPEGWILISTIPPKPETTISSSTTESVPQETPPQSSQTEELETTLDNETSPTTVATSPSFITTEKTVTETIADETAPSSEEAISSSSPITTTSTEAATSTEIPTTLQDEKPTTILDLASASPIPSPQTTISSTTADVTTSPPPVEKVTMTTEKITLTTEQQIHEFVVNVTLTPMATLATEAITTVSPVTENVTVSLVTVGGNYSEGSQAINGTEQSSSSTEPSSPVTEPIPETTTESYNMSNYNEVCGRRIWPEARIVGGAKSGFGKWPWQISLRQWRTSTYLHKCGAALLNQNWAITAAHCVEHVPPSELLVRLGEHDLANESEPYGFAERRVQLVASHPHFDPATFEYDLALLRFYEPVTFQPNILPVCVPDDDDNYVGKTAYVTGWGRLYDEGPLPSVLQEVEVPVINNSACEGMYQAAGYNEHIPNIFICAGLRKGGADSCEGDSGGPMVVQRDRDHRFVLGGVISWGIGCAEPNQPGVYTRISEFRDWINQILQF